MNSDIKEIVAELIAQGLTLAWSQTLIVFVSSGLIAGAAALLVSYFTKRGELRAVNENFATTLSQLKETTDTTKRIEAGIKEASDRHLEEVKSTNYRKNQAHRRFVEYYLEGAIDPLCAKLIEYQIYYSSIAVNIPAPATTPEMPSEALARVETLFGVNQTTALFFHLYSAKFESNLPIKEAAALSECAMNYVRKLNDIRYSAIHITIEDDASVLQLRELTVVNEFMKSLRDVFIRRSNV